jgi:RIO-like serine/threonine protein kinase
MPSELFKNLGNSQPQKQQNPREQALNLMKQQGIDVPQGMENNPQAIIQHLMQSGRVPQNRLTMAQQMMGRMFRR